MSKGKARYRGKSRPRTNTGEYRPCPTWGCRRGYIKVGRTGERAPHQRCGGDGYIKVGEKRKGRPRGKGKRKNGPRGPINRAGWYLGWSAAVIGGLGQTFGTVGHIVGVVLVVAFVAVKLVGSILRVAAAVTG